MLAHARQGVARALLALVVACASTSSSPPALTEEAEAELSARALALTCGEACVGEVVQVRDRVYETMGSPAGGDPLSDSQRLAIGQQFGEVQYVNDEEVEAIYAEDGIVYLVGPISQHENGLVEVEVSSQGFDSILTNIVPFGWNGHDWVPSNNDQTVFTVTTLD